MRCEECLAVVEEYFDGELERRQSELVSAHMAACEGCAEALDALASEQEMYLRYDRELEVAPALWENVRAGVARLEEADAAPRSLAPRESFAARLAAVFGSLAPRAAFAPALALVLLAAFVGALWLARGRGPEPEMAQVPVVPEQTGRDGRPAGPPAVVDPVGVVAGPTHGAPVPSSAADVDRVDSRVLNVSGASASASGGRSARGRDTVAAAPPAPDHLAALEDDVLPPAPPETAVPEDVIITSASARLLTPEEKEMAQHLEQAQRLLRSFQNEVGEGGDAVQVAYERRLSRKLLEENASLRLGAEAAGDRSTRQVLDSLEPFLLDIANLRDNASRDEVRSIKERMQKKEIIAALHVY